MRHKLPILLLPVFILLLSPDPVNASPVTECQEPQAQTQAAAKLKPGQFVRIRTVSGSEVKGHFRSFDGSRIVLEDKRNYDEIIVASVDIVRIRTGRGFFGALRHGVTESGRIMARPVTMWIEGYQVMAAIGDLLG